MKNYEKVVVGIVLVIILVLAIYSSIPKEEEKMISIPVATEESVSDKFKDSFMDGCMGGDSTSYTMCTCAYNSLVNQLGDDGIIDLSINYLKTEQIPEKVMTKVIKDCAYNL